MNIEQSASPNFNTRKTDIDMLVLHYTGMEGGEEALLRMQDAVAEVSAHYMVWEDGRVSQLVNESARAWHAGVGSWQGDTDLNSCSIGIEIVNGGHNVLRADGSLPSYADPQIEAVIALCTDIVARHNIPDARIVGHSDIAPTRKEDPGEHFPWARLAKAGLGLWPEPAPGVDGSPLLIGRGLGTDDEGAPVMRLQEMLSSIGYGIEISGHYGVATEAVIRAFQRHWRAAMITGQVDLETLRLITAVKNLKEEAYG